MPQQINDQVQILAAIERTPLLAQIPPEVRSEWLRGFVDSGNGKSSGPLVHLVSYEVGERLMNENEWGGNTFMILVSGHLHVLMKDPETRTDHKANEILPGESFAEMSLFAGVPRNATVVAVGSTPSLVLEIARQAFRGLEKKSIGFVEQLGRIYEARGLSIAIERVRQIASGSFSEQQLGRLQQVSAFRVFGRSHVLCEQGQPLDKVYLVSDGWVRRGHDLAQVDDSAGWARLAGEGVDLDFLGGGNVLGFDGITTTAPLVWNYTTTVMLRTEVIEIDLESLRADKELLNAARKAFTPLAAIDSSTLLGTTEEDPALSSTEQVITTGIIESDNVLVMDMDLCIRCGNCSFACEKVHGQSRLVRRGIHIERSPKITSRNQHILVPEVCISCQDPECLTGCPTGAIARLAQGQIDIEPETCTGCAACARLCPYNAISMIEEKRPPQLPPRFGAHLASWLGFRDPTLPAPVTGTKNDNLVAVKCNLCADTPLNPPGARKPAYSCEENCPTGALVRVNPREYFGEVPNQSKLWFQTPTMATGRNIHRHDPVWWWCHAIGGALILLSLIGELYLWKRFGFDQPLSASFHITLRWLTGFAALAFLLAAMIYSVRRRQYRRRAGPLRYWMLGHVYVGGLAAITIAVHGGSHKGGPLTTALMVCFDSVLLTGLFGLVSYYVSPRLLTRIEGDPILLEDLQARRKELRDEISATGQFKKEFEPVLDRAARRFGSTGYLFRQIWRGEELSDLHASARKEFRPVMPKRANEGDELAFLAHIEKLSTIRRLDALIFLHRLLKIWLPPHIIATALMLALIAAHILQVTVFSVR